MSDTAERLVHMANQIAVAFRTRGAEAAAQATCEHIVRFWDPRMRRGLLAHLSAGGAGLNAIARAAADRLAAADGEGVR